MDKKVWGRYGYKDKEQQLSPQRQGEPHPEHTGIAAHLP